MKVNHSPNQSFITLIRVVVWGHLLGYLWRGISIAIEDAPDVFARAGIGSFVWPIVIFFLFQLSKADKRLSKILAVRVVIIFSIIVSLSTMIVSITDVIFGHDIPEHLITSSWRYWQAISVINLLIYLTILILTVLFSIRALRDSSRRPQTG